MYEAKKSEDLYSNLLNKIKTQKRNKETSPHKYILLLSLTRLFEENTNRENRFYFTELEPVFLKFFNQYYEDYAEYRKMLEHPFYHLKNDGFWFLQIKTGLKDKFEEYEKLRLTKKRLIETVEYAYLAEDIFQLFLNKEQRNQLKRALIDLLPGQYKISEQDSSMLLQESSLFEHEQIAIETISNSVAKMKIGKMLSNVYLHDPQTNNYYEYDIILITPSGLYVIELKHWSSKIAIAPHKWVIRDTQYRPDPHITNNLKCKILKGNYQHQFRTYPNIWVESIVILTNPDAEVEGAASPAKALKNPKNNITFASIGDFLTYIKRKTEIDHSILTDAQMQNIANYIHNLNQPKDNKKYTIPGYETVAYISEQSESVEILGRLAGLDARGLNRFRVFRLPASLVGEERERFKQKAYNTIEVVSALQEHPNILKVWLVPNDEGDIIEGSDWSETGTLRDYIKNNQGDIDNKKVKEICYGIIQGLNIAHRNNIIHRALSPENILLYNDIPKLMNFDLAYKLDKTHISVIGESDSLPDTGYIAPEVLYKKDIDETTDYFSLGVIAYELFTGLKPFSTVKDFMIQGGQLDELALNKLRDKEVSEEIIDLIDVLLQIDRHKRQLDVSRIIRVFSQDDISPDTEVLPLNAYLQSGDTHGAYEIIELIGEGREAQIYKAKNARSETIALKLFNKEISKERIFHEGDITSSINSTYVVGCNNIIDYWKEDRYFLVLDYIEGESMRSQIEQRKVPSIDEFRNITRCLLQAIQACHINENDDGVIKTIIHSDIKPDNIIITKDSRAVLIDFGMAGPPRVDVLQGTLAYIPPDSISGTDMQFSPDGDLFALGISLWEWLVGQLPYEKMSKEENLRGDGELMEKIYPNIWRWLEQAIALEREKRFSNIDDMITAFEERKLIGLKTDEKEELAETIDLDRQIALFPEIKEDPTATDLASIADDYNDFVFYLNTLSNASAGNENATAEAQVENRFFADIRVEHYITSFIYQQLFEKRINIILTGNAGDGKTTIAAEIYRRLNGEYKPLAAQEDLPDLVMIKDLSELPEEERSEIFNEAIGSAQKPYLIVSNTGTLVENLSKIGAGKLIEKSQLLEVLEADHPVEVGKGQFLIVNIGRLNSIKTAIRVAERMLEVNNWQKCQACSKAKLCPIYTNVQLLQENLELILSRITIAYQRLYEYGNRLTMRQMTGHLAYMITAGLDCETVSNMSNMALEENTIDYLFSNSFFGDDGENITEEAMQLLPIRKIREAELGIFLDPYLERVIWKKSAREMLNSSIAIATFKKLQVNNEDNAERFRIIIRRFLYFLLPEDNKMIKTYLTRFLRSPMLLTYLKYIDTNQSLTKTAEKRYLRFLLQVLQETFVGVRLLEDEYAERDLYITLKPASFTTTQMILGKARAEDFSLGVKSIYDTGEIAHYRLTMFYQGNKAELELDLPFLDYVARRYRGEVTEELSVFYTDRLQKFKVNILENMENTSDSDNIELLSITGSRKFEIISFRIEEDKLEVII